jgi:magnesium chelatase family protein
MNPCPCGYYNDPVKECTCSSSIVTKYQKRLSGPLLDRIDIHIEVPRVDYEKLSDHRLGEASADIRAGVETARERQRARFKGVVVRRLAVKRRPMSSLMPTCLPPKCENSANWMKPAKR